MASKSRNKHYWRAVIVGLLASSAVAVGHLAGLDEWAENRTLDLRFRHLPATAPSAQVVHVDLDEKALEAVGRWPWPRLRIAQLAQVISACGARAVVLDMTFPWPQEPRYTQAGQTDLYQADPSRLISSAPPVPVLDDVELADALAAMPNVFLGVRVEPAGRQQAVAPALSDLLTSRPALSRADLQPVLAQTGEGAYVPAKRQALDRALSTLLAAHPDCSLSDACSKLLGDSVSPRSEDYDLLRQAYLNRRGLIAMQRLAMHADTARDLPAIVGRLSPPLVTLSNVLKEMRAGFVSVEPDSDGVIRRVGLLARTPEGIFPQLGLILAVFDLAKEHEGVQGLEYKHGKLRIAFGDGLVVMIPVDAQGRMVINWAGGAGESLLGEHISAAAVAEIWTGMDQLRRNADLQRQACQEMAGLIGDQAVLDLFAQHDRAWKALHEARVARQAALLFDPGQAPPLPVDLVHREEQLEIQIDRACKRLLTEVDSFHLAQEETAALAQTAPAVSSPEQANKLSDLRFLRGLVTQAQQESPAIARRLAEAQRRLSDRLAGRVVLVGATDSSLGDFHASPIRQVMPGILVHANAYNTIVARRFVHQSSLWLSTLLVLLAGGLVALAAPARGTAASVGIVLGAIAVYLAAAAGVWLASTYWLAVVGPVAAMLASFTAIKVYGELTEGRGRRQITSTFKQYLSPVMVDRLSDEPDQAGLGGQQCELSCLFLDVAGFTTLSEQLGPSGTVLLLNHYLDEVGLVVQDRFGGTLSRYEGDGVFAFFGAPLPQADHAARAIEAMLALRQLQPELNVRLHAQRLLPDGASLVVRAGVATGTVFVGNMGSTRRVAYTAIGDAVNLASRLESANKLLGTRGLVCARTWAAGGEKFRARPLGRIGVVGRREPVDVYEPLGVRGQLDAAAENMIAEFSRGISLLRAGEFAQAAVVFQRLHEQCADAPAGVYLAWCRELLNDPSMRAQFDGTLRLSEK